MKKIGKLFVCLILALVFVIPFTLTGCFGKGESSASASAAEIMKNISGQFESTMNKIAAGTSQTITEEDLENDGPETNALTATNNNASKVDYISALSWAAGFIYAIDYMVKNSRAEENEYANVFEFGATYAGEVVLESFGVDFAALKITKNEGDKKINIQMDLLSNDGTVNVVVDAVVQYDFSKDVMEKIDFLLVEKSLYTMYYFVEIDTNKNEVSIMSFRARWSAYYLPHAAEDYSFAEDYTAGTLTYNNIADYSWDEVEFMSANITDNYDRLRLVGYFFDVEYGGGEMDTNLVAELLFDQIYRKALNNFTLRTENLNLDDATIVSYIKDAGNYGENKATVWHSEINGKEVFEYLFVEYEDMIKYLAQVKEQILGNDDYSVEIKQIIASAYGYVNEWGKLGYTMQLGTWDGVTTKLEAWVSFININGVIKKHKTICISNEDKTLLVFFSIENNTLFNACALQLTNAMVYAKCESYLNNDSYSYIHGLATNLKNYCGNNNDTFQPSSTYYIEYFGLFDTEFDAELGIYDLASWCIESTSSMGHIWVNYGFYH